MKKIFKCCLFILKDSIDDIQLILETIFKELDKTKKGKKIIEKFFSNIDEIKLPGIGISLKHKPDFVRDVKNNFANFLLNIIDSSVKIKKYIQTYKPNFLIN